MTARKMAMTPMAIMARLRKRENKDQAALASGAADRKRQAR